MSPQNGRYYTLYTTSLFFQYVPILLSINTELTGQYQLDTLILDPSLIFYVHIYFYEIIFQEILTTCCWPLVWTYPFLVSTMINKNWSLLMKRNNIRFRNFSILGIIFEWNNSCCKVREFQFLIFFVRLRMFIWVFSQYFYDWK